MDEKLPPEIHSRFLREWEVLQMIHISSATLSRLVAQGRFPRPVKLSANISAWKCDEVEQWMATRPPTGPGHAPSY